MLNFVKKTEPLLQFYCKPLHNRKKRNRTSQCYHVVISCCQVGVTVTSLISSPNPSSIPHIILIPTHTFLTLDRHQPSLLPTLDPNQLDTLSTLVPHQRHNLTTLDLHQSYTFLTLDPHQSRNFPTLDRPTANRIFPTLDPQQRHTNNGLNSLWTHTNPTL